MRLAERWERYWFTPEAPLNLGVCRIGFYGLVMFFFMPVAFSKWAQLPAGSPFWQPMWLFRILHLPVLHANALGVLSIAWKLSLVLACIGLFTRISTIVAFVLGTYLIGLQYNYGKIEHSVPVLIFVLAFLALSRCGDALSIDARLRALRGLPEPQPSGEFRWPIRAVWLLMSLVFFAAGIAKIRSIGFHWGLDQRLSVLLIQLRYHAVAMNGPRSLRGLGSLPLYVASQPWAVAMMGIGTLCVELLFPLSLLDRRARAIFPAVAFSMQVGIVLLMNVWFTHYLATYLFWVPWSSLLKKRGGARQEDVRELGLAAR